jgi:arylsulfatase A-like enzyme
MNRRTVLKTAAGAAGAAAPAFTILTDTSRAAGVPRSQFDGKNLLIFVTDQERAIQHFPEGWAARRMPGMCWLANHGLTFTRAFTNSCMCSPARATWLTGYLPAQHQVKYTLELDMEPPKNPQVPLAHQLKNIASVMASKGYDTIYKGKFHLTKPADGTTYQPSDMTPFGFDRWNPPDAGADQSAGEAGGGTADNDGRFMNDDGPMELGEEGILDYLNNVASPSRPFCLIVSLVNPHDVLFYPKNYANPDYGYDDSWLIGDIGLPATVNEDLSTKPSAQAEFLRIFSLSGAVPTPQMKRNYLNFYGNLMASSDRYLVQVLQALRNRGLLDDTLIVKTSDHGEMGMTHNGMRQKCFNFYEESIRVPLIFSNPKIYRKAHYNHSLVSHVDFLPTLAGLFNAPSSALADWEGVDYSRLITNPGGPPVQDYTVFTYEDWQAGQANPPYVTGANRVVSFREQRFKLAEYYDPNGQAPTEWEMYDLLNDPLERNNLAFRIDRRPLPVQREFARMRAKLEAIKQTRLQPLI